MLAGGGARLSNMIPEPNCNIYRYGNSPMQRINAIKRRNHKMENTEPQVRVLEQHAYAPVGQEA